MREIQNDKNDIQKLQNDMTITLSKMYVGNIFISKLKNANVKNEILTFHTLPIIFNDFVKTLLHIVIVSRKAVCILQY